MATKRAAFTEADVRRALKGAAAAGVKISRIEIGRDGTIVLIPGEPAASDPAAEANEWDRVLNLATSNGGGRR